MRFLFILLISSSCFCQENRGLHISAGFTFGAAVSLHKKVPVNRSMVTALATSALAGTAKELHDVYRGYKFSSGDLFFTVLGGAIAGAISIEIKREKKKKIIL